MIDSSGSPWSVSMAERADLLNVPVVVAAEMAFRHLESFLKSLPNPPGEVRDEEMFQWTRLEEIRRLSRGD